ncbi:alpha/beta hydrolase [Microlunatus elymi]|uniref:Alpha/beta hydrolase n=2 Tax=Microlunatus elymi TaxID=2596828 RepID=A0A516Q6Y8_9ACTN|nr:alpha/beta hydrolase [Microlunatus elymi]
MMHQVTVPGGQLAVEVHAGDTAPVLAIHGVSSNARLWNWLRAEDPGIAVVAPDLRGRAGSVSVGMPSSLARHASDLVAVLDHLELDRATVCGMSMGGFVAVELANSYPDRVAGLVLIDGGFPMPNPGLSPEMIRAAFAAQASRADQYFADGAAYRDYFLSGPTLLDGDDPLLLDYLEHDLADHRVRLDAEVMLADASETLLTPPDWTKIIQPTRLVYAEWSVGADSAPAYTPEKIAEYAKQLSWLQHSELIPGADHAATIMTRRGAAVVADNLRAIL